MHQCNINNILHFFAMDSIQSTVFAAVTIDGKVHVFDLHHDKYKPLCVQVLAFVPILILIILFLIPIINMLTTVHKAVVSKSQARLTHISFNLAHPVIITGDNKGQVVIW